MHNEGEGRDSEQYNAEGFKNEDVDFFWDGPIWKHEMNKVIIDVVYRSSERLSY